VIGLRRICLLCLAWLLSGCTYAAPPGENHGSRVVQQVEITVYSDGQQRIHRYSDDQKMGAVLQYIRALKPSASVPIAPDTFRTDAYRITLRLSDGTQRIYHQLYDVYLMEDGGLWRGIDPSRGATLRQLLMLMESD
jgi:hypothetical protein